MFESPVTGVRVVVRIGTEEPEGDMLVADLYVRRDSRRGALPHAHRGVVHGDGRPGEMLGIGPEFPYVIGSEGPGVWPRSASAWAALRRTPRREFSRSTFCRSRTGSSLCPIPVCHRASGGAKARYASRDTSCIVSLAVTSVAPSEKTTT